MAQWLHHHETPWGNAMGAETEIQVSRLLDERGLSSFQIRLLAWSIPIALIDGYDIGAISFAAPHLVASWGIARSALGPVLSASNIGFLFGAALFGWIGDRYGRKAALISANLLFGVFTFAAAYSTNLDQLFWLRLIAGFAIAALTALFGWPILFEIGGIVPILIALAAVVGLPESIKYMALHESHRRRLEKIIAAIRPGLPANARFVIEDEKQSAASNPLYLFRNGLWLITPLSWLLFALNLMGFFFLISWTPTLLMTAKLPPATAALAGALLQGGGTVGALTLCWWLQRHRFLGVSILLVLATPFVGAIGYAGLTSESALLTATFCAGFLVVGIQIGMNVVGAMLYPTSLRANGSGWQLGLGRLGSIVGPLVGAFFVGLPVERLYMWSTLPFAAGAVVCFVIYRLNEARLNARPELRKAQ